MGFRLSRYRTLIVLGSLLIILGLLIENVLSELYYASIIPYQPGPAPLAGTIGLFLIVPAGFIFLLAGLVMYIRTSAQPTAIS